MASNNYNSYNHPYHQQSSAQPYSSYQTAPVANTSSQSSRQYQPTPSAAPVQPADYVSYSGPSYGTQSSGYGAAQDNKWSGSSNTNNHYGTVRDNGSRAAEVLQSMSNTGYATTTTAPSQPGFTVTNASTSHSARYSPQMQSQQPHTSHSAHGQSQARPWSANTNQTQASASRASSSSAMAAGYQSQRAQPQYNQQPAHQRTASPAQTQYSHSNVAAAPRNASISAAGTPQQYSDYNRRQLPNVDSSRTSHTATPSVSYTTVAPPSSIPEPYSGASTTVDPTAVYDPWPEYQRQQAIRDAARAGQERKDEEARKERERVEQEEREERERVEEEQRRQKEEALQAQIAASQSAPRAKKTQKQQASAPAAAQTSTEGISDASAAASELESEIRAMMAKMRELNGKDPQLLARIWEEERRAKAPKPSTTTTKPAPQPAIVPPAQVPTPPIANQRKKATPREPSAVATPVQAQAAPVRTQAPPAVPVRTGGNTIWPSDKKLELTKAAAHYLTTKNPDRPLEAGQILQMLNSNPSYIELCEQLEQMGFKLDRSVFAKSLLQAVPDVNSASCKTASQPIPPAAALKAPAPPAVMKHPAPPAVMKHPVATPAAPSPRYAPAAGSSTDRFPFPGNDVSAAAAPIPVAEMIPIKPELKPPANKEEAARKRNLSDLIDLTQLDEDDDMDPPMKRLNTDSMYKYGPPHPHIDDARNFDVAPVDNFPTARVPAPPTNEAAPQAMSMPTQELRYKAVISPLDKKKALRRNTYNPATIARDVLLACGRHPSERQLNQHLDVLKANIPQISNESDLSTIKWNLIDPGNPPPGYFKDSVQALAEDAGNEDDSEDEDRNKEAHRRSSSHTIGGESARVQALPAATNPFTKQRRRGRPPRHSLPNTTTPATPSRPTSSANMSASAPRPSATAAGVGYSAFRSATDFGPDGQPLPKKKGRPVGWRKAIHGSAAAQSKPAMNGHTGPHRPQQPSTLRNVRTGDNEPIRIDSRSPSVADRTPQYQSFKCKWQNCKADLHNFDTLRKHVFKVHKKETLECLWNDCGKEVAHFDPATNMSLERHTPHTFGAENAWRGHLQRNHFDPLAWEQGDGPAGGLSDAHDSEAYLSDAQGRRLTPRITPGIEGADSDTRPSQLPAFAPRGRGRPAKNAQEQDARDTQNRLVSQKKRMGGLGMDRGGATLVNDKRRRGLIDSDGTEEELVDAED